MVEIKNRSRETVSEAYIFVCVLGASNYVFAEAHIKQDLAHWLAGHTRAFDFFGGVTEVVIMKHLGKSRRELFESLEKTVLRHLRRQPYNFWEWRRVKVPPDYHVKFDNNYYSVPLDKLVSYLMEIGFVNI
jgi:FAD/FMN-containing dehydrogenase